MAINDIKIAKLTLNIGVGGEAIESLQRAEKLLTLLSGQKPVRTYSKATISEFGTKKNEPIGTKVTIRGKKASEILKSSFEAVENQIQKNKISDHGNFSFGVGEYIEMPGMKYDPDIGMFGFDISVNMERIGYRIAKRRLHPKKLPKSIQITREEIEKFLTENYGVKIE